MPELSSIANFNLSALLPELTLVLFTVIIMFFDVFTDAKNPKTRAALPWIAFVGVFASGMAVAWLWGQPEVSFQDAAISDRFALGLSTIVLVATGLTILLSVAYIPRINRQVGEYYALILLCAVGMMLMGLANDLIILFLALEIFSLGLYILTGIYRKSPRGAEASMKYFLLGAFASAFFVYGAALIYGAAGSTQYNAISEMIGSGNADLYLLYPGIALLIAGFGFKVSLVPFHMWTPDVYQGSPTPVTAFMSAGTKAAAFAAMIRVLVIAVPAEQANWGWMLATLAVLTMTLGNLAALRQTSLKRMLAYSSIAHAGYILVGLVPGTAAGANAALFYLFSYAFMNMGALAAVIALENIEESDASLATVAGLSQVRPKLAFVLAIFMFGLSGMPPLAGFFGKLLVFQAAVAGGWAWLAAFAMLTSVVGAYYYLRVIVLMYFKEPTAETDSGSPGMTSLPLAIGLGVAAAFTIIIGIAPGMWTSLFQTGLGSF
jgi:NADH-quinone oxidoreductase subunit N